MCGIVGYIGPKRKTNWLVEKLKKLEYRGYDSSGVASIEDGNVKIVKAVGKIAALEEKLSESDVISCAIAHTRWATHGKPTEVNAHPHSSTNQSWTVVHNGIIENYLEIKNGLKNASLIKSDTDTAVVAEILAEKKVCDINGFIDVCSMLKGSFALGCINKEEDNSIYLARNKSPLYVAYNNGQMLLASDPICFVGFSENYYVLNNNEFAKATQTDITFYDQNKAQIKKDSVVLDEIMEESGKGEYLHFMIKEIMEEPVALNRIVKSYTDNNVLNKFDKNFFSKFNKVEFIGCGTAYHAGLMGARYIEKCARVPATSIIASEFIYMEPIISPQTLYIFVSQSGETADTLRALELVKKSGAVTIAVTNVLYASLAKAVDYVLPVCAGPEIAVASTKAYVCQIAVLYMLAKRMEEVKSGVQINYIDSLKTVIEHILKQDYDMLKQIAEELKNKKDSIYIGKDLDYITALEGSLKLKEIAYNYASSYPSGELKHGFLALIEEGTIMFVLANHKSINAKTHNAASEAVSRGAKAILIGPEETGSDFNPAYHIKMPNIDELLLPMVSIMPLQYIAYLVSKEKGINPDQPRNLAKSVTVE